MYEEYLPLLRNEPVRPITLKLELNVRQLFVNILTPIRGTLTVNYRTLQYSQPVRTECKADSNSSETIAIRVPACIGNKNMNFTVKGNPS